MTTRHQNAMQQRKFALKKVIHKLAVFVSMAILASANAWSELPNTKMYYQTNEALYDAMVTLRDNYPDLVTLKSIGYSWDYYSSNPQRYEIYAIRIGPVGPSGSYSEDGGDPVPSILFEGNIHGREWLSSESLMELANYIAEKATHPGTWVNALLRDFAVWIIPVSNPAGRVIDETDAGNVLNPVGDPEVYFDAPYVITEEGWRNNGDTERECFSGTDIARNFSTDWINADEQCDWFHHYRGLAPFSSSEATALREFVQNHSIMMAIDVHSQSQEIWNGWGNKDQAGRRMRQTAVERWDHGLGILGQSIYDPPAEGAPIWEWVRWYLTQWAFMDRFELDQTELGTNAGQFVAWLGEEQHMQSFVIELLPNADSNYNNTRLDELPNEFRFDVNDNSNTFHPSSSRVQSFAERVFIPMAEHFIGQAHAPGCATTVGIVDIGGAADAWYTVDPRGCPVSDYGIVAAKLGKEPNEPGMLQTFPAVLTENSSGDWTVTQPATDFLELRAANETYSVLYWVQNFGLVQTARDGVYVRMQLRSRPHDFTRTDYPTFELEDEALYRLERLQKQRGAFEFDVVPGRDYELTIELTRRSRFGEKLVGTDLFQPNDVKIFRFTTVRRGPVFQ